MPNDLVARQRFVNKRREVRALLRKARGEYKVNLEKKLKTEPNKFWKDFNCGRNNRSDTKLFNFKNHCYNTPGAIAQAFADYFSSIFTPDTSPAIPRDRDAAVGSAGGDMIKLRAFTIKDTHKVLKDLKQNGPLVLI